MAHTCMRGGAAAKAHLLRGRRGVACVALSPSPAWTAWFSLDSPRRGSAALEAAACRYVWRSNRLS